MIGPDVCWRLQSQHTVRSNKITGVDALQKHSPALFQGTKKGLLKQELESTLVSDS